MDFTPYYFFSVIFDFERILFAHFLPITIITKPPPDCNRKFEKNHPSGGRKSKECAEKTGG